MSYSLSSLPAGFRSRVRVQRFTPEFVEEARPARRAPGDRWFVNVKVCGRWTYPYRAVDEHGQVH